MVDMERSMQRGGTMTGFIVVIAFLSMASIAFWVGTAPPYEEGIYDEYGNQYRQGFPQDPGAIAVDGISDGLMIPQMFTLSGFAEGWWFNENVMPMAIVTPDGSQLWEGFAEAQVYYMYAGSIPFIATVDVGSYTGPAEIIIRRANESGDPSYDKEYRIPVVFTDDPDAPSPGADPL